MNWAVVNEAGEVVTIVRDPQGKLPPGCRWVAEADLPPNFSRRPPALIEQPDSVDVLRNRMAVLEAKLAALESKLKP